VEGSFGSREIPRPAQVSASENSRDVFAPDQPPPSDLAAGLPFAHLDEANVFVLFDTSNYMYRSFVFAQDAITDFVRSMDGYGKIAFYSYSRNLLRATTLT